MPTYERILVPVDLSADSLEVVERALDVATEGGELLLLHVVERIEDDDPALEPFYERLCERARTGLAELAERIRARGRGARSEVLVGRRAEEILAAAERYAADLVVLGSHPMTRESGLLDGLTVSFRVALLARCAVLLVRTPRSPASR